MHCNCFLYKIHTNIDTVFSFSQLNRGSKNELELELPMKEVVQVSVIVTTYQLILVVDLLEKH